MDDFAERVAMMLSDVSMQDAESCTDTILHRNELVETRIVLQRRETLPFVPVSDVERVIVPKTPWKSWSGRIL